MVLGKTLKEADAKGASLVQNLFGMKMENTYVAWLINTDHESSYLIITHTN